MNDVFALDGGVKACTRNGKTFLVLDPAPEIVLAAGSSDMGTISVQKIGEGRLARGENA